MALRYLRKVNRFPMNKAKHNDDIASLALSSVTDDEGRAKLSYIQEEWHRPSGDTAILKENLLRYGTNLPKRCVDGDYLAILKKTLDELRPRERIIPLTLGAAARHPDFPRSTSPGFPWVNQGYHTRGAVLDDKLSSGHIHRAWDMIGRGIPWSLPDSLAFHRVVASERHKEKVRPVWGYPTDVILEEARFFYPLLSFLKEHCDKTDAFYGLGLETMRSGHEHLARSFNTHGIELSLCADLSSFDANVTNWIIRDVFAMMSDWFDFSRVKDSEGKIWNVNPEQTCRRWKAMVSYFINTKVRMPDGTRIQKKQGVPSGSMFTNILDTIVNAVQMRTCLYRCTGSLPAKDYYFGDDSTIFLACRELDLDALSEQLNVVFGGVLSTDKTILTDNSENIQWLGYFYRLGGPRRSIDFILASTLFPERAVDGPIDSAARMLGQLYSCMDQKAAVLFYDAIVWIMRAHNISREDLELHVSNLSSKSFKYLTTLGLDISDIVLPTVNFDPFGDRYISSIFPRPSSRSFVPYRDVVLPEYSFAPEAYCNRHLRHTGFTDFQLYIQTRSFYDEFDLDAEYFTD